MPLANLTDSDIFALRTRAAAEGNADLSRLCSRALWAPSLRSRNAARKQLAGWV